KAAGTISRRNSAPAGFGHAPDTRLDRRCLATEGGRATASGPNGPSHTSLRQRPRKSANDGCQGPTARFILTAKARDGAMVRAFSPWQYLYRPIHGPLAQAGM